VNVRSEKVMLVKSVHSQVFVPFDTNVCVGVASNIHILLNKQIYTHIYV